mmetsp:Transcript_49672/g.105766  ORF Transcript_49672/g.105766 Transcript_49672/m.105766 type:complete len:269 (+) Transcript_49672:213-1019(+)
MPTPLELPSIVAGPMLGGLARRLFFGQPRKLGSGQECHVLVVQRGSHVQEVVSQLFVDKLCVASEDVASRRWRQHLQDVLLHIQGCNVKNHGIKSWAPGRNCFLKHPEFLPRWPIDQCSKHRHDGGFVTLGAATHQQNNVDTSLEEVQNGFNPIFVEDSRPSFRWVLGVLTVLPEDNIELELDLPTIVSDLRNNVERGLRAIPDQVLEQKSEPMHLPLCLSSNLSEFKCLQNVGSIQIEEYCGCLQIHEGEKCSHEHRHHLASVCSAC